MYIIKKICATACNFLSESTKECCHWGGSNFWVCTQNPMVWPFKWHFLGHSSTNKFVFQHFTKRNLEILLNVDFGHIWECMGQTWTRFVGAKKTLIRNFIFWNVSCVMPCEDSHHTSHCPPPHPPSLLLLGYTVYGWVMSLITEFFYNLRVFSSSASEGTKHT